MPINEPPRCAWCGRYFGTQGHALDCKAVWGNTNVAPHYTVSDSGAAIIKNYSDNKDEQIRVLHEQLRAARARVTRLEDLLWLILDIAERGKL